MNSIKAKFSAFLFTILLSSSMVSSQELRTISESRTSIMHAVDPQAYMLTRLRRLAPQAKDQYPYETPDGIFFILPGSDDQDKPATAFIVESPEQNQDFGPQAVWLSCLDTLASLPQKKSTLFVLIPPKTKLDGIISELSRFEALRAIILFENSSFGSMVRLKAASKSGQAPRSLIKRINSIFSTAGLRWSESSAAYFFFRFGYLPDTGRLASFHGEGLPAVSLLVNLKEPDKPGSESLLLAALSKIQIPYDEPTAPEYNYLNFSIGSYHVTIGEKLLIIILLACFLGLLAYLITAGKPPSGLKRKTVFLLNGIIALAVFFAITAVFDKIWSGGIFNGLKTGSPVFGYVLSSLFFLLLTITSLSIYFSLLTYLKLVYDYARLVYLVLFADFIFFAVIYLPIAPYFCFCALVFLVSGHKAWLSALCCLMLSFPLVLITFLNFGIPAQAFAPGQNASMPQSIISALVLFPFFLWISLIIERWIFKPAKKLLVIGTAISSALILGFIIFKASGKFL